MTATDYTVYLIDVCPECDERVLESGSMCNSLHDVAPVVIKVVPEIELERLLAELKPYRERAARARSADRWSDAY